MNTSGKQSGPQAFAILPAAGESRRMGEDKLLLPWEGSTVVDAVIDAWEQAGVDAVVAVANPGNRALIARLRQRDVDLLVPSAPPVEMKHSVQLALDYIDSTYRPRETDLWLLAPADMPRLSSVIIRKLIELAQASIDEIVIPIHAGRRGHPALFRWNLAKHVFSLGEAEGINAFFARHAVREVELGPAALPGDIDTPEEYRRMLEEGD